MKKNEISASKADTMAQSRLSFGKAILILMGVCSLYSLLIPERVLIGYLGAHPGAANEAN
jgi:hypothetical protein